MTAAAQARAAQAGPLAQAEAQQEVTRKQTELAQLEADRRAKELLATHGPAGRGGCGGRRSGAPRARRAPGSPQAQADAERVKLAGQAEAAVTVAKGEAAAKIVSLTADADAHKVEVEGNAEAGIVFAKGDAEAKALALRAEAYRQFNEAAVLQTVLSMLPEIVRAAAEPIGKIQSLTVLSSDGASDVVKTATDTLAQASTTIKGLTGIDLPAVIANALGGATSDTSPSATSAGVTRITGQGGAGSGGVMHPTGPTTAAPGSAVSPAAGTTPRGGTTSGRRVADAAATAAVSASGSATQAASSAADAAASAALVASSAADAAASAADAVDAASDAITRVSKRVSKGTEPTV